MDDTDSTYQTKRLQLMDNVLSFDPHSRIDDSPGMETLTATVTERDVVMEQDVADFNDTLQSNVLHDIYAVEVLSR
jgi:hypothetical protein